jgi:hypothetical protein
MNRALSQNSNHLSVVIASSTVLDIREINNFETKPMNSFTTPMEKLE